MEIFPEALENFKRLLQFNTANPPGNEREAIHSSVPCSKKKGLFHRLSNQQINVQIWLYA